ncbi:peptidase S16 [Caulobacter sp. SLTY]|uniref:LON peptidase substrate-binding domain-containing protein n=1 Tax=Caulobacter sp. SLTY TaxID=2683262 RepID=UPI0014123E49|nr:LON peptidase substrate-binding domain-containing protein [Caulobacter sp. SLTY]NBB15658.1 peptidase S16 [Caulobacter sp. SLTY]
MVTGYRKIEDLPQAIPVFPLDGAVMLPGGQLPLNIFEPRYLNMFDDAMGGDRIIGMVQTRAGGDRERPALSPVGCAGRVTAFAETGDGRYLVTLTGVCRFRIKEELGLMAPYRQVRADYAPFIDDLQPPPASGLGNADLLEALKGYLEPRGLAVDWEAAQGAPAESLIDSLSMGLPFEPAEKQALLEAVTHGERGEILTALLRIGSVIGDDEGSSMQ